MHVFEWSVIFGTVALRIHVILSSEIISIFTPQCRSMSVLCSSKSGYSFTFVYYLLLAIKQKNIVINDW